MLLMEVSVVGPLIIQIRAHTAVVALLMVLMVQQNSKEFTIRKPVGERPDTRLRHPISLGVVELYQMAMTGLKQAIDMTMIAVLH